MQSRPESSLIYSSKVIPVFSEYRLLIFAISASVGLNPDMRTNSPSFSQETRPHFCLSRKLKTWRNIDIYEEKRQSISNLIICECFLHHKMVKTTRQNRKVGKENGDFTNFGSNNNYMLNITFPLWNTQLAGMSREEESCTINKEAIQYLKQRLCDLENRRTATIVDYYPLFKRSP